MLRSPMDFETWNMSYPLFQYQTEPSSCPKYLLCFPSSSLYLLPNPWQPVIFFVLFCSFDSTVLSFAEYHIIGITQLVAFPVWFIYPHWAFKLFHELIVLYFFFLISKYFFIVWVHHSLFTHLLIEGSLGCFQFLVIINKTGIYILQVLYFHTLFSSDTFLPPFGTLISIEDSNCMHAGHLLLPHNPINLCPVFFSFYFFIFSAFQIGWFYRSVFKFIDTFFLSHKNAIKIISLTIVNF